MKNPYKFLRTALVAGAAMLTLSCSPSNDPEPEEEEEKKCGEARLWDVKLRMEDIRYSHADSFRTFSFENTDAPDRICPNEHVKVNYIVFVNEQIPGASWFGKAYWGGLYGEETPLVYRQSGQYDDRAELGLKEAFGDNPGYINLRVFVRFRTLGSEEADREFIRSKLGYIAIYADYKSPKD